MYGKFILAAVLLAFFYVQLGDSLQCYNCRNPIECRNNYTKITCNSTHANNTRDHLAIYYQNVPTKVSNNYDCVLQNYTQNNQISMTYMGCAYRESNACSLALNPTFSSFSKQDCKVCSGNLCNFKSSASGYSISAFTMLTTLGFALLAKTFVY